MTKIIKNRIIKFLTSDNGHGAKPIVLKRLKNGCVVCISHKLTCGYLLLTRNGKQVYAHRLIYEYFIGPIPEDKPFVLHKCDNRACLSYKHFFIGTHADNMKDMFEKGRVPSGEKHVRAKLTSKKVYNIRKKYKTGKYTYKELGKGYGVDGSHVGHIVNNRKWVSK
jgi:hypothetical protein